MKIIYDDQGRLSEVIFAENDDQTKFWDAFNKANEEITNRCKILQEESTERCKILQEESTEKCRILQEENTKSIQIITKGYLGIMN